FWRPAILADHRPRPSIIQSALRRASGKSPTTFPRLTDRVAILPGRRKKPGKSRGASCPKGRDAMVHNQQGRMTRRALLKAGAALPLVGVAAPNVRAQPLSRSPTTVLDFKTNADVAKAEQEGQLVFYCHENEAGTAGIMQGFAKDFPKIKT